MMEQMLVRMREEELRRGAERDRQVRIPTSDVAATVFVPDGANIRVHTGSLTVGGDGLGAADDVLVVIGMQAVGGTRPDLVAGLQR